MSAEVIDAIKLHLDRPRGEFGPVRKIYNGRELRHELKAGCNAVCAMFGLRRDKLAKATGLSLNMLGEVLRSEHGGNLEKVAHAFGWVRVGTREYPTYRKTGAEESYPIQPMAARRLLREAVLRAGGAREFAKNAGVRAAPEDLDGFMHGTVDDLSPCWFDAVHIIVLSGGCFARRIMF